MIWKLLSLSFAATNTALLVQDAEFNSSINRAASQAGAVQFKLILATLEQNLLNRIRLANNAQVNADVAFENEITNFYPKIPLKADKKTWQNLDTTRNFIHAGDLTGAKLWQIMHPEALSLFNDAKKLDDQVIANSSYFTQNQHALSTQTETHGIKKYADDSDEDLAMSGELQSQLTNENELVLEQDPTMLFELLNQLSAPSALPSATTEQGRTTQAA